jgi:uncharacterized membrane protein YdjX (TVP38/TMEM64 family)
MGLAKSYRPIFFILLISTMIWLSREIQSELTLEALHSRLAYILELKESSPLLVLGALMGLIIVMTSFSIPGSIVLTVLSGSIYGAFWGTVMVSISATTGATVAFLLSRYFFQKSLRQRLQAQVRAMDQKIKNEGAWALLTVRLLPCSPFVVVNLVMGLTSISPLLFAGLTFTGMFPGTFFYVYAGEEFAQIESLSDIMSAQLILGLVLLGCVPYIIKSLLSRRSV